MIRFYFVPIERQGEDRGPKYFQWPGHPGQVTARWSMKDYGIIDYAILAADVTPSQHDTLAAQADVYPFPENLDVNPNNAEVNTLTAKLEGAFIPANWLVGSMTYRQILRTITGMFLFMQALTRITGTSPLEWGVSLTTQFRNVPADKQQAICEAYAALEFDAAAVRDNWTLRVLLKNAADQWGSRPIYFGIASL